MNKIQKRFAVFALFTLMYSITSIHAFAEDEEGERESEFGERERGEEIENEQEGEGYGSLTFSGMILYVTIAAILAAIGYTVFKIIRTKKKTAKQD